MLVSISDIADKTFDYIVVGGGTAGLVVAARLSENPNVSVCVLEAGDANIDDPSILQTGVFAAGFGKANYDWSHMTTKQKLLAERSVHLARGRGLGGSSGMNFMVWQRPPADELDDFERLGNPGWNWSNIHKYIKKAERFVEPSPESQAILDVPHQNWDIGRNGPLPVAFPLLVSELDKHLQQACFDVGIKPAADPYGGKPTGAYFSLTSHDPQTYGRAYSVTAYYQPNKTRSNLTVLVSARGDRVHLEKSSDGSLVATAVKFSHEGKSYIVKADKEVLLTAGALQSSVILERSGIGRKEVLEKANIPVKLELPGVGENLQEHIVAVAAWELKDEVPWLTFDVSRDPHLKDAQLELYKRGKGSFCLGFMDFAFVPVETVSNKGDHIYQKAKRQVDSLKKNAISPSLLEQYEIQLERLRPGGRQSGPGCEFILTPGLAVAPTPTPPGKKYIGIASAMNHLLSRGSIHVISNECSDLPEIDPHYFEHDADLDIFVEMVKLSRKMATSPALSKYVSHEIAPGAAVETDEQLANFLKQAFSTTWHTASTCSMLPREKDGVVDNQLKVYGTSNLRVIDLSIVPLHFAAHPQAAVYGIAEMASDIIKGELKI